MSQLKLLRYRDLARLVQSLGFAWIRCGSPRSLHGGRGSHNTFRAADGRVIVLPDHGNQVIVRPLLRKIVRDLGLTVEEYNRLVESL